jgi:tetratricopeptide (TPR) repeat protein
MDIVEEQKGLRGAIDMIEGYSAVEVFCSYAREDEEWLRKLETHLSLLKRQGLLSFWHNRLLAPGTDWAHSIDTHLETSAVILLLISSDFLASDYCYELEMQRALQRHEANLARVIPIIVRPCDWQSALFGKLQMLPRNGRPLTSWDDPDEALYEVALSIRSTLEDHSRPGNNDPSKRFPVIWNIPYPRNTFFTGRENLLERLHERFQTAQAAALSQPLAISGLGGIGKTQLAIEYAYRYRQEYQKVLWARAETTEELNTAYAEIARMLNLPQKHVRDQEVIVEAVKGWLSSQQDWLLILDNADDLSLIHSFLPTTFAGHLLLTTRAQAMGRIAQRIQVDTLDQETGALFLLRRVGLVAADASLETATLSNIALAQDITKELGGLPLALDQAGAYIEETACGLADYKNRYRTRSRELLRIRRGIVADHPQSVATTWSLSFEQAAQRNPVAADLLCLCAFLAPDAIPDEIIREGMEALQSFQQQEQGRGDQRLPFKKRSSPGKQRKVAQEKGSLILDEAIAILRSYSLITRDSQTQTLTIHRLVQVILRDTLPIEIQKQWMQRTVNAVEAVYPGPNFANWTTLERLLPHMLACATWIAQASLTTPEAAYLLNAAGLYLSTRAQYKEAKPLLEGALAIREQQSGAIHADTAISLNNLAILYRVQGKYEEAEPLYQRALAINEQIFGSDDSEVATNLNNLALLYKTQGRYEEAEPLYLRALAIDEQAFGPEHPAVATDLNNLALLYQIQEQHEEAGPLLKRALAIREQQLGAIHPDTATSLNNLAVLYRVQGQYEEAERLLKRALAIREQQLGPTHPATATSLNNLGELYEIQGRYGEAEQLLERALAIREQQLGPSHPDTATSLNSLAVLRQAQEKYAEVGPLYQRALAIREQKLGPDHYLTQTVSKHYAHFLQTIGRDEKAK